MPAVMARTPRSHEMVMARKRDDEQPARMKSDTKRGPAKRRDPSEFRERSGADERPARAMPEMDDSAPRFLDDIDSDPVVKALAREAGPKRTGMKPKSAAAPARRDDRSDRPFRAREDRGDRPSRPREDRGDRSFRPREDRGDRPFQKREGSDRPYKSRDDRASRDRNSVPRERRDVEPVKRGVERIARVLARAGLCSRREAEEWIEAGRIKLNGQVLTTPAIDVGPEDKILVDGKPLPERERTRL